MLFAAVCAGCGAQGPSPCQRCVLALVPLDQITIDGVDHCHVLLDYDDLSRRLITRLKYGGVRSSVAWFALGLANRAAACSMAPFDAVTWVPAARANRRKRGYDQSELIARPVARRLHTVARRLLKRRAGPTQTGLNREERRQGPSIICARPVPRRILLVDDVVTTGASLRVASEALRAAGAAQVVGIVVAHRRFRSQHSAMAGSAGQKPLKDPVGDEGHVLQWGSQQKSLGGTDTWM